MYTYTYTYRDIKYTKVLIHEISALGSRMNENCPKGFVVVVLDAPMKIENTFCHPMVSHKYIAPLHPQCKRNGNTG